jgi:hypothetical protein
VPKVVIAAVAGLFAGLLFLASNVTALHDPQPHRAPVAVAGAPAQRLQAALDKAEPGGFRVVQASGTAKAEGLIRGRDAYGALVVEGSRASVLTASADGFNAATAIQQALTQAGKPLGVAKAPTPRDVVPLQKGDPRGVSLQQIVLGTIIGGFMMGVFSAQLALNEPLRVRLLTYLGFGLAFGALAALIVGPLIGVLTGHTFWVILWLGAAAFAMATTVGALARVLGQLGILAGVLLLLILGNPSAGASSPTEFLPGLYRTLGPYLPPNAAANGLLGTTYFDANVVRPGLVLGLWALLAVVTQYAVDRIRGRRAPLAYAAAAAAAEPHADGSAAAAGGVAADGHGRTEEARA